MKIIGLDGKEYKWNPSYNQSKGDNRSELHKKAKKLIEEMFPHDIILEEVSLAGSRTQEGGGILRADMFVPNRNLIVEVHGEQHHKFNKFFFKNKLRFYRAQARDREKKEWCNINDIRIVELNYNEDLDEWRKKIE